MDKKELEKTNNFYNNNKKSWQFWEAAYNGADDFIELVVEQHTRETLENFEARKNEAMVFNLSETIVDLFNFYLTEKTPMRNLNELANDPLWKQFQKDADLNGTNFDVFLNEKQKVAAIFGAVGILVDKPPGTRTTKQEEIDQAIYPYCAAYTLLNILDWTIERNIETARRELTYLKLRDSDGKFLLWWKDRWEIWEISMFQDGSEGTPVLFSSGPNGLGEIPFFWMINIQSATDPYYGVSDIKEICRIQASITRNLSCGEEVIKFAGFPQARRPFLSIGDESSNVSGVRAILEFDPELGEAGKPDWLESEVFEPIQAIISWVELKVGAIYDMKHISGIHATAKSMEARSGAALRAEFQQLNSVLIKKNENLTEAELAVIRLWTKWQNQATMFKEITITRPKEFSIDDLSISLDNIFKSMKMIFSEKFVRLAMKHAVKKAMPDMLDHDRTEVDNEIDVVKIDLEKIQGAKVEE